MNSMTTHLKVADAPSGTCVESQLSWSRWVTPVLLANRPIHRWCVFPHSFTDDLVKALVLEWGLGADDRILDPFAGAGTTLVAAQKIGIPSSGYDLSPFAVLASKVKTSCYRPENLRRAWVRLQRRLETSSDGTEIGHYPALIKKALPKRVLESLAHVDKCIAKSVDDGRTRDFFRLALLSCLPLFSKAVPTGGWLKWSKRRVRAADVVPAFRYRVTLMMGDVAESRNTSASNSSVAIADARALPDHAGSYSAVITSPPYPNRHDYTRVFGIELMFGFLNWEETRALRYQSFHSHPEARPERPSLNGYTAPANLTRDLDVLSDRAKDKRVHRMIEGYFQDIYLSLAEMRRVCRRGAHLAIVVGNAQYAGHPILVDELTAEIGEQVGLVCEKLIVARYRGNSAQQMGRFGRVPSRESVVVFKKP